MKKENRSDLRKNQKAKIIHAAIEMFSRKGYIKATVQDIARQAGVAKGLVYYYFRSKEQIFFEAIEEIKEDMHQYVRNNIPSDADSFEQIRIATKNYLIFFSKHQEEFIIFADQMKSKTSKKHMEKSLDSVIDHIRGIEDYFIKAQAEGLISSDAIPHSLALMLFAQVQTFMTYSIITRKKLNPQKIFKQIDRYFLQNLKTSGDQ